MNWATHALAYVFCPLFEGASVSGLLVTLLPAHVLAKGCNTCASKSDQNINGQAVGVGMIAGWQCRTALTLPLTKMFHLIPLAVCATMYLLQI